MASDSEGAEGVEGLPLGSLNNATTSMHCRHIVICIEGNVSGKYRRRWQSLLSFRRLLRRSRLSGRRRSAFSAPCRPDAGQHSALEKLEHFVR